MNSLPLDPARLQLGAGVGFALTAGLAWGLVFVAPVLLPDYCRPC